MGHRRRDGTPRRWRGWLRSWSGDDSGSWRDSGVAGHGGILARIAELPYTRVHELLPRNWKVAGTKPRQRRPVLTSRCVFEPPGPRNGPHISRSSPDDYGDSNSSRCPHMHVRAVWGPDCRLLRPAPLAPSRVALPASAGTAHGPLFPPLACWSLHSAASITSGENSSGKRRTPASTLHSSSPRASSRLNPL